MALRSLIKPLFSAAEIVALHRFVWEHGRCWKRALREEWRRGCARLPELVDGSPYRAVIQRLRDRPGFGSQRGAAAPSHALDDFRLPEGFWGWRRRRGAAEGSW